MATLQIRVFGGLQVAYEGQRPLIVPNDIVAALLAYLVLHPGLHEPDRVAQAIFPERPPSEQRVAVSAALRQLNLWLLPRGYSTSPYLVYHHSNIGWNTTSDYWLDSAAFQNTGDPTLYRGEFLAGWTAPWIFPLREAASQRYLALPPPGASTQPQYLQDLRRWPLVGRKAEFAWLTSFLPRPEEHGQVILVTGEAGIGKSRLLDELTPHTAWRNIRLVHMKCDEATQPAPYSVWASLLRDSLPWASGLVPAAPLSPLVIGDLLRIAPDLRRSIPHSLPPTAADPTTQQAYLARLLNRFVAALAQRVPHILILDDMQWADAASFDVLNTMIDRIGTLPILLVVAMRDAQDDLRSPAREWLAAWEARVPRLRLQRLNEAAIRALVTASGGHIDGAHDIWESSEGLPLFAVELFIGSGSDETRQRELPVSARFRNLIRNRLQHLHSDARLIIEAAAVLGRCDIEIIASALGMPSDSVRTLCAPLTAVGFLRVRSGGFSFAHDKIREIVYELLPPAHRKQLHLQTFAALQQRDPDRAEELADQALGAGEPDRALPYLILAGDRAASLYANADAVRFFTEALEIASLDPAKRFEVLMHREAVLALMGRRAEQAADVAAMLDLATQLGSGAAYADALLRQANLLEQQDRYAAAVDVVRVALDQYRKIGDTAREAAGLGRLAQLHFAAADYRQAERVSRGALRIERSLRDGRSQAATLQILGQASYNLGNFWRAERLLNASAALCEQQHDQVMLGRVLSSLGIAYILQGRLQHYLQTMLRARDVAQLSGDRVQLCKVEIRLAYGYLCLGMHQAGRDAGEFGLGLARELEYGVEIVTGLMYLALIAVDSQQIEQGVSRMQEALRLAIEGGNQNAIATATYNMATVYVAAGRFEEAARVAAEIEEHDRRSNSVWRLAGDLALRADAVLGLGRIDEALRSSSEAVGIIQQHRHDYTHPQEVWMIHSRVLMAAGYMEEARDARRQALTHLLAQASEITDPELRRSFLEDAPLNRRIMAAADEVVSTTDENRR